MTKWEIRADKLLAPLLAILSVCLVGCATVPMGTEADKQVAVSFTPQPGKANVYIIRQEALGGGILATAAIDTQMVGGLQVGSFVFRPVTPGAHIASVYSNENQSSVPFNAEAGRNYFFEVESEIGLVSARFVIHQMSEQDGKVAVQKCRITLSLLPLESSTSTEPEAQRAPTSAHTTPASSQPAGNANPGVD